MEKLSAEAELRQKAEEEALTAWLTRDVLSSDLLWSEEGREAAERKAAELAAQEEDLQRKLEGAGSGTSGTRSEEEVVERWLSSKEGNAVLDNEVFTGLTLYRDLYCFYHPPGIPSCPICDLDWHYAEPLPLHPTVS